MNDGGQCIIGTPNSNDILNELIPGFKRFFYRTQHRWYFNKDNFSFLAKKVGFRIIETRFIHRYKFSNFLHWTQKNVPVSDKTNNYNVGHYLDNAWEEHLNESGKSDNVFFHLIK